MDNDLVLLNTFDSLSPSELVHLRTVCKHWRWLIRGILKNRFRNRWEKEKIKPYIIKTELEHIQCCCIKKNKIYIKDNLNILSLNLINRKIKVKISTGRVMYSDHITYVNNKFHLGDSTKRIVIEKGKIIDRSWILWNSNLKYPIVNSKGKLYSFMGDTLKLEKHVIICGIFFDRSVYFPIAVAINSLYMDKNDNFYVTRKHNTIIIYDSDLFFKKQVKLKFRKEDTKLIIRAVINDYFFVEESREITGIYNIKGDCVTRISGTKNTVVYNDMLYTFDIDENLLVY